MSHAYRRKDYEREHQELLARGQAAIDEIYDLLDDCNRGGRPNRCFMIEPLTLYTAELAGPLRSPDCGSG